MLVVPTWDLFITLFFVIGVGYGAIMQREKILSTLVSVYIGMAVATVWGPKVYAFLQGNNVFFNQLFIRTNASEFTVKTFIFAAIVVLLTIKGDFSVSLQKIEGFVSSIFVFIYSFLNTGLIISTVIFFLPAAARQSMVMQSNLAEFVVDYRLAWVVLPALLMIVGGFLSSKTATQQPTAPPAK